MVSYSIFLSPSIGVTPSRGEKQLRSCGNLFWELFSLVVWLYWTLATLGKIRGVLEIKTTQTCIGKFILQHSKPQDHSQTESMIPAAPKTELGIAEKILFTLLPEVRMESPALERNFRVRPVFILSRSASDLIQSIRTLPHDPENEGITPRGSCWSLGTVLRPFWSDSKSECYSCYKWPFVTEILHE